MLGRQAGPAVWFGGRRDFLRVGGGLSVAGFLTPTLPSAPRAEPATGTSRRKARACILVYLLGGPPQLDMWDLKPSAPAEIRGPFRPTATHLPELQICEHLPRLAQMARHYALVRSVSHNNHNHTPMIYYTLTGRPVERPLEDNDVRPPQRTDFPHLGGVLAHLQAAPDGLPGYVAIPEVAVRSSLEGEYKRARTLLRGGGGGFLGPLADPLAIQGEPGTAEGCPALSLPTDVAGERAERRAALLDVLDRRHSAPTTTQTFGDLRRQAVALSGARGGTSRMFALDGEPPMVQDRYGRHRFGKAMLLARRLAEAGVPMTAVHFKEMTRCDGWDTHSKNFQALQGELLPMLDQGLSALLEDLDQRCLLEETFVMVLGEFGRTPRINKDAGRDHWGLCQSVLLAGGGIKGAQVYGSSDRIGAYPATNPVDPVDLHATLYHCMGLDPEQTIGDRLGRLHPLSTGRVLTALVS